MYVYSNINMHTVYNIAYTISRSHLMIWKTSFLLARLFGRCLKKIKEFNQLHAMYLGGDSPSKASLVVYVMIALDSSMPRSV